MVITCKICELTDHIGGDMDDRLHKGFTIGNGRQLYWYMIWHQSGHVSVFACDNKTSHLRRRYIKGNTTITVHFK